MVSPTRKKTAQRSSRAAAEKAAAKKTAKATGKRAGPAPQSRPRQELHDGPLEVLVCGLEGNRIGLPFAAVDEVVPFARLAEVPEAPPWVPGRLTLRGEALTVLDIAARVRRTTRDPELSDLIVVSSLGGWRLGFMVQEVLGVQTFDASDIQSPGDDMPQAPYLSGVHSGSKQLVFIVDLPSLVALSDVPGVEPGLSAFRSVHQRAC